MRNLEQAGFTGVSWFTGYAPHESPNGGRGPQLAGVLASRVLLQKSAGTIWHRRKGVSLEDDA
jgi:hypothetical protein